MSERRRVLELFEEQKDFMEERVNSGIERYRKGNACLTVVDEGGKPVEGATVRFNQTKHQFRFGANIFMLDELETEEKNRLYKERFKEIFNIATLPFYWDALEPERGKPRYSKDSPRVYRRPAPELCVEFCRANGIEPREHALAYDYFFPKWLYDAEVSEVKEALERRFREIAERFADDIPTIEVTNEMEWYSHQAKTKFYDEPDFVEWCFRRAEEYFPNNQLCINERTGLCWYDRGRVTDKYYAYIEANMLKGARIDAIGMQYHMFFKMPDEYEKTRPMYNPESLYRHMDLYSRFGKPLQVTEITIPAYTDDPEDEAIQAAVLEKLYPIWFSHPNMEQIIYWNVADGYAHLFDPDPEKIKASQGNMSLGENYYRGGLLRFDMSPKPAYEVLRRLIREEWHTEGEVTTDSAGKASFRGFGGDYELEITANGRTVKQSVSLLSQTDNGYTVRL